MSAPACFRIHGLFEKQGFKKDYANKTYNVEGRTNFNQRTFNSKIEKYKKQAML